MVERVAILGVGLIGGSLGLAWQRHRPGLTIVGCDRPAVLDEARRLRVIDEAYEDIAEAVAGAEVVVLATPLHAMPRLLSEIAPHLQPGAVVTDVGSVKRVVVDHAREVLSAENPFVGGHPMAGAEHSGVAHADPFLFENATYVLCPPDGTDHRTLQERHPDLVRLIEATGARVQVMPPDRHDHIAAVVSHLPQLLAVVLMNYAAGLHEEDEALLSLAAGGFRDMTRIASSPFGMWRDILAANHGPILDVLSGFATALQKTRHRLAAEDFEALQAAFATSREARDTIPKNMKGFLRPLSDVYVHAEDRPGELLNITRVLHERTINIKDIELLKIREGTAGAFRLGFSDEPSADAAAEALHEAGYTAHRL